MRTAERLYVLMGINMPSIEQIRHSLVEHPMIVQTYLFIMKFLSNIYTYTNKIHMRQGLGLG